MRRFIKVDITEEMEKDYDKCFNLIMEGIGSTCIKCSCNGGANIGCIMSHFDYKEVEHSKLCEIAEHHGYERQSRQCMEECGELIQAISKFWRKVPRYGEGFFASVDGDVYFLTDEYKNLVEEIADVEIMLTQLKILLRCGDEVVEIADQKVLREIERM